MFKKLMFFVCVVSMSLTGFSQTFTILEGDESALFSGISRNGKWAVGSMDQFGSYLYNFTDRNLLTLEDYSYADGVSDAGVMVGAFNGVPAYYKDNKWTQLSVPSDANGTESFARAISSDGKVIVGHLSYIKAARKPCIWTMKEDGTYSSAQMLPIIEKDFTGRSPQGVDALRCSGSGDVIVGRMVDFSGYYNLPVCWKKDQTGAWKSELLLKDLLFKEGVEIPTIIELTDLNAKEFFSHEDSLTFQAAVDAYNKNPEGLTDPESGNISQYITNTDSIDKYNAAVIEHNKQYEIFVQQWASFHEVLSGYGVDAAYLPVSANGKYLVTTCLYDDPDDTGEPEPMSSNTQAFPLRIDLSTGEFVKMDWVDNMTVDGVTNNGDVYCATPYMEMIRSSYVIPNESKSSVELTEWVSQKTDGKLDIKSDLLFDVLGEETLITGDVYPSEDGNVLMGRVATATGYLIYFVELGAQSVDRFEKEGDVFVYPNPATDALYIKGNVEKVDIVDLAGRSVYQSSVVGESISVSSLVNGTYLVKVTADGKISTHKVIVAK